MSHLQIETVKTYLDVRRAGVQGIQGQPASSNRIIMSVEPPTTREDGSPLQANDIWIKIT